MRSADGPAIPARTLDARRLDGSAGERIGSPSPWRERQPDRRRARWCAAAWATEKADERALRSLAALREGIRTRRRAFLEAQLRDRAAAVRDAAQASPPLPDRARPRHAA